MKLTLTCIFLISTLSFASNNCHEIISHDLLVLAKQSNSQRQFTNSDFQWLAQKLEMAASYADGNGFSCVSYERKAQLNYTVVILLKAQKDIPSRINHFLSNLKYNKKFQD